MASEEHKCLSGFLKSVHTTLRQSSNEIGAIQAWNEHCKQREVLEKYAHCMEKLATEHWDVNYNKSDSICISRIKWSAKECYSYFVDKLYETYRKKEIIIAEKIDQKITSLEYFGETIKFLDIGSCYNPFKSFEFLDVLAIDLCPANNSVLQCDFLNVPLGNSFKTENNCVLELQEGFFEAVAFCFVLEYIPSSELRILACLKAYNLLKPGGLLIINTPDSNHVHANCKIMKCWRYTLALMGFSRIRYEKFAHMHCMVFRKALIKETAIRWATLHKLPYMEYCLNIPQDKIIHCKDDMR